MADVAIYVEQESRSVLAETHVEARTLDLPRNYDIPLRFNFGNTTIDGGFADYRAQLWVNGYQFGKYTNIVGAAVELSCSSRHVYPISVVTKEGFS